MKINWKLVGILGSGLCAVLIGLLIFTEVNYIGVKRELSETKFNLKSSVVSLSSGIQRYDDYTTYLQKNFTLLAITDAQK